MSAERRSAIVPERRRQDVMVRAHAVISPELLVLPRYHHHLLDTRAPSSFVSRLDVNATSQATPDIVDVFNRTGAKGSVSWSNAEGVAMTIGTVKWFDLQRGYGFIQPEDGSKDAFVHISAVEFAGLGQLREGQKVSYDLTRGKNGKDSAGNLALIE